METKREAIQGAYFRIFSSDDGKIILKDLERQFEKDDVFSPDPLEMAGRARELEVVRYIKKLMNKGKEL